MSYAILATILTEQEVRVSQKRRPYWFTGTLIIFF